MGTRIPEPVQAPLPQSPFSWDGGGLAQHTQGKAGRTAGWLSAGKFSLRVHFTVQVYPGAMQTSSWLCPSLSATKAGPGHSWGVAPMEWGEALTASAHACLLNPAFQGLPGPLTRHVPHSVPGASSPISSGPWTPELLCKLPSSEPPWAGAGGLNLSRFKQGQVVPIRATLGRAGGLNLSCFKQGQVAREALHQEEAGWRVNPTG